MLNVLKKKLKHCIKTLTPEVPTGQTELTYKTTKVALQGYTSLTKPTHQALERHTFMMLAQEAGESTHSYVTPLTTGLQPTSPQRSKKNEKLKSNSRSTTAFTRSTTTPTSAVPPSENSQTETPGHVR